MENFANSLPYFIHFWRRPPSPTFLFSVSSGPQMEQPYVLILMLAWHGQHSINQASAKQGLLSFTGFVCFLFFIFCFSAPTDYGFSLLKVEPVDLESQNFTQGCIQVKSRSTQKINAIGQIPRSRGQKETISGHTGLTWVNVQHNWYIAQHTYDIAQHTWDIAQLNCWTSAPLPYYRGLWQKCTGPPRISLLANFMGTSYIFIGVQFQIPEINIQGEESPGNGDPGGGGEFHSLPQWEGPNFATFYVATH